MAVVDVDPGIVDKDVEPADLACDVVADRADGSRIGEVAGLDMGGSALLLDARGDALQRLAPAPGQHHRRALLGQHQRRRLADAAAGAGDPGDFPLELRQRPLPQSRRRRLSPNRCHCERSEAISH
jgi:hypothetical protein